MTIQSKLVIGSLMLAILPVGVASLVIGFNANGIGKESLETQAQNQLIAIRETKKSQIEGYFQTIRRQILTFSNDRMVIDAMREFKHAFPKFREESKTDGPLTDEELSTYRDALAEYYSGDFTEEYKRRNAGKDPQAKQYVNALDADSVALQYHYIKANPSPLGSKDQLVASSDSSTYSQVHAKYHPHIRDFLEKFGYYDIFLADPETGDLVYTVFKELDYTTSMIDGPYAESGIGQVFQEANQGAEAQAVAIVDFDPYFPSYQDQAGFIASPIFDGEEKLGILIFQMPIDVVNGIMTNQEKWKEVGLGTSGETYLIGPDFTMRNQSRFLIEDQENYLKAIQTLQLPKQRIELIRAKRSSIGLQKVQTKGTQASMEGKTAFEIFPDYRGVPVLSAYAPVEIEGLQWVIMSEIDEAEAFNAVGKLTSGIVSATMWVIAGILLVVLPIGLVIGRKGAQQFEHIIDTAQKAAKGDLTQRVPVSGNHGLGAMGSALNEMLDHFGKLMGEFKQAAEEVSLQSTQIRQGNDDLSQRTAQQAGSLEETSSSMEEMTGTVKQNAENAGQANRLAIESRAVAQKGGAVTDQAVQAMEEINKSSKQIADIITVIDEIAFQTNLLALNAAVEAARAGEQGRGFAVVASEVRNLAQRSASAAKEIKDLINESVQKVADGSQLVHDSGQILKEIVGSVKRVTDIMSEISNASDEQTIGIEQVNHAIMKMDRSTQQNTALVEQVTASAEGLQARAADLLKQVDFFSFREEPKEEICES